MEGQNFNRIGSPKPFDRSNRMDSSDQALSHQPLFGERNITSAQLDKASASRPTSKAGGARRARIDKRPPAARAGSEVVNALTFKLVFVTRKPKRRHCRRSAECNARPGSGGRRWAFPVLRIGPIQGMPDEMFQRQQNWEIKMTRGLTITSVGFLGLLSLFNLIALVLNISQSSRAAVGGMNYEDLMRDSDFTRAVKSIVQECKVNVDVATLKC